MSPQAAPSQKEGPLAHVLPPLPYASDALEPYIDKMTMEIHHGKHHNAYVTNLNKALEGHADLQALSIDQLLKSLDRVPENIRTAVRNNGGGHWNHSMFWKLMKKGGGGEPVGRAGGRDQVFVRLVCRFQDEIRGGRSGPVRLGLGLAHRQGRQAGDRIHAQPGQSADGRRKSDPRPGRLGACLLPEISKPPPGLHRGVVERRQLGRSREPLLGSEIAVPAGNSAGELHGVSRRSWVSKCSGKSTAHPDRSSDGPFAFVGRASACLVLILVRS